jgi:hypothetical protein
MPVELPICPDAIRDYEDIKRRRIAETKDQMAQHLERFTGAQRPEALPILPNDR